MGQTVLEMIGIKKSFSGIYALSGIDFSLELGEVHALLGENGAGKSTLIKVLGGIYQPDSGIIKVNGKEVKINGVPAARENGIGIIHQEIVLVPYLSVAQNLFLGREIRTKLGTLDFAEMNRRAEEMISSLGVNIKADTIVENLTIAQQQMVEIVKAVSFNGKIIVMDEPTSSLSNEEVEQLFEIIENLRKKQVSIIYISHRMEELFRISDRVTVIRDGAYVGTKKTSETSPNELVAMMVGRDLESFYARDYCDMDKAEVALEVKNLSQTGVFEDISFSVHKGEILGVAGLDGSGRTELLETLFGYRTRQSGTIKKFNFGFRAAQGGTPEDYSMEVHDINGTQVGEEISNLSPNSAIKQGFALVTEERRATGIFGILDIRANTVIANLKNYKLGKFPLLSDAKMARDTDRMIEAMHIKTPSQRQQIKNLSGGNQQKVIFGRWMLTNPDVLLLDDPTRGIDVGAKYEIYELIQSLAKQGKSIIMVSSEMPELLGTCNRILVMSAGQIAGEYVPTGDGKVDQEKILELAAKNL